MFILCSDIDTNEKVAPPYHDGFLTTKIEIVDSISVDGFAKYYHVFLKRNTIFERLFCRSVPSDTTDARKKHLMLLLN